MTFRSRNYRIRPSEFEALGDIGKFRVVEHSDLVRGVYGGQEQLAQADLRSLKGQDLVAYVFLKAEERERSQIHTLTASGKGITESRSHGEQRFYSGFAKPAELQHDALLYRAYLQEEKRIAAEGGTVKRVILDYELKAKHFAKINKPPSKEDYRKRQEESAHELHLPIVDGRVVIPDFQVELEDERGELSRVSVEVATGDYRGKHLHTKLSAGFRVYASGGEIGLGVQRGSPPGGSDLQKQRGIVFPL